MKDRNHNVVLLHGQGLVKKVLKSGRISKSRIRAVLDFTIATLMAAILFTLSLPVCMAVVEQKAVEQTLRQNHAGPHHTLYHGDSKLITIN